MKKKFKDLLPKPSDAVQAMVDGLLKQSKRKKFVINMGTFGDFADEHKVCFGCAATCAIQYITKKNFHPKYGSIKGKSVRAKILNWEYNDLDNFETIIDYVRLGRLYMLFNYYDRNDIINNRYKMKQYQEQLVPLETDTWKKELYRFENLVIQLRKDGL